jgi:uncharacterized protein YkwD
MSAAFRRFRFLAASARRSKARLALRLSAVALLAAALVTGCGGSEGVSAPPPPAPAPAASPEPAPAPPPAQRSGTAVPPIDAGNRAEVVARWQDTYFDNTPFSWSGSVAGCVAGDTTAAFKQAVVRRLNYFRAMAGLPGDLALDTALSAKAQQAALMMDAADRLSHSPGRDWPCYSADGAEAAATSLLAYSNAPVRSVSLVDGYLRDRGANNAAVGHRRWILYPPLATVGTGDTPQANAIWIVMPARAASSAAVAWPPRGFMPRPLMEPTDRFSLACPGASFAAATVTLRNDIGQSIAARVESRNDNGYGDNAIVWSIDTARSPPAGWDRGSADTRIEIELDGVANCAAGSRFVYSVTFVTP